MSTDEEVCFIKELPGHLLEDAAATAIKINPANHPDNKSLRVPTDTTDFLLKPLALRTDKRWNEKGTVLTVGFMDNPGANLAYRILIHMNAWGLRCNVYFVHIDDASKAKVRIKRTKGDGYWSYLGTDICLIASDKPTMNLAGFTTNTSESEFYRVVRHETGHTLGFPHEHLRKEVVD